MCEYLRQIYIYIALISYTIPHICLPKINKTAKCKLIDTLIQWNSLNIPEFSTTPGVFFSGTKLALCH